ncbi:MAG TPA: chemotaxis protein CheA [Gemmatimonadaceae bacterium]|nr:chemotaxis protein CheA [Gemmatimonadaceae bacterium]
MFLTESREHVSAINHALLALERAGARGEADAESVGAIFRAVHTVKGMSATMGFTAVASLSHELETLLDGVRRGVRDIDERLMDLLFRSADVLESAIEVAVAGREEVDVAPLVALLRAESTEGSESPAAPAPATPAKGAKRKRAKKAAPAGPGPALALSPWKATMPDGAGLPVRVRLVDGTPLKGVRAFLVVQAARALGEVVACSPSVEEMQADAFDHDFALRLRTERDADDVEATLRRAGDVAEVLVGDAPVVAPSQDPVNAALAAPGDGPSPGSAARGQRSVRIDLRRLDSLMNLIGELVITRGRLHQLAAAIDDPALTETVAQTSRLVADLQDEIMTSRMVPVWQVFDRFPRLVRDAARSVGKQVEFVIEGKEVELDRSMLDEVGDPIVHLLRNAIDHGIETPDTRRAQGKNPQGRLVLSATRDRSAVAIRVSDDGRGIDRARVLAKARAGGLVDEDKTDLSDEELLRLISRPGFSTADTVSDLSGRGVGIDAVYNRVRALGGAVDIRTIQGEGTTVTLRLPLTLAIVRSLLARIGDETYAVPLTHVRETVELEPAIVRSVQGREVLMLREEVLPVVRMRALVQHPGADTRELEQVIVVEMAERRAALVVDALVGQQEIVVKQFDGVRDGLGVFGGATILGDGVPALIFDVSSLL